VWGGDQAGGIARGSRWRAGKGAVGGQHQYFWGLSDAALIPTQLSHLTSRQRAPGGSSGSSRDPRCGLRLCAAGGTAATTSCRPGSRWKPPAVPGAAAAAGRPALAPSAGPSSLPAAPPPAGPPPAAALLTGPLPPSPAAAATTVPRGPGVGKWSGQQSSSDS